MAKTARQLMNADLISLDASATVGMVLDGLTRSSGGFVILNGPDGLVVGIITWADMVTLMHESNHWDMLPYQIGGSMPKAFGLTPEQLLALSAKEIMHTPVESLGPDGTLEQLTEMLFAQKRKFVVLTEGGRAVGWVPRERVIQSLLGSNRA